MKFHFIAVEKAHHSLSLLCRCLRVTRSGFYAWRGRPESARSKRDRQLKVLVHASFAASKGRYGSPRIHRDLREDHQERVSRKRVIRLMREEKLQGRRRKPGDHVSPWEPELRLVKPRSVGRRVMQLRVRMGLEEPPRPSRSYGPTGCRQ